MMGLPGRPSPAMDRVIKNELHQVQAIPNYSGGPLVLLFAITKKCPLRCAHCFEWEVLNQPETLSKKDILSVLQKFQKQGIAQVELSGGEPLNRLKDILEILQQCDTTQTDFWLLTSGYQLTAEKAKQLKQAGLHGVSVSLDHWRAEDHDRFRGLEGAYEWALKAVQNARKAGLLVSLTLVPTHTFCTGENLWSYADLARKLQVHFIRILEPRAVGHYAGMPVELTEAELAVCENFVREIQLEPANNDFPLVEYHATFQRKVGCGGAGRRYLYIDTDGDFHVCPFCRRKCGSALTNSVEEMRQTMQLNGSCQAFSSLSAMKAISP